MVRVQNREVVVYGKFREYYANVEKIAELSKARGWAVPKIWAPSFGKNNEVIMEWEYGSLAECETENQAWQKDAEIMGLVRKNAEYVYPQSSTTEAFESAYQIA